jgi:hypothetical protein
MEHEGWTYIFLRGQRKAWHHHEHRDGWEEVAHERGNYIECGVYRKLTSELTDDDRYNYVKEYGEEPDDGEWFNPIGWEDPRQKA